MFIRDSRNRLVWSATLAIAVGILLGGGTARWENRACTQSEMPATYCVTEVPEVRVVRGMVGGALASGGALLAISLWARLQNRE